MSLKSGIVAEQRRIECVRTTARKSMNAATTLKGDAGHGGNKKLGCVLGRLNLLTHAVATAIALHTLSTRTASLHHLITSSPHHPITLFPIMPSPTLPKMDADTVERLRRLRSIAWLLDNSIPLPGGWRIGIDALIGLIPGIGDAVGAAISAYIINEARRLGAPRSVLMRMTANVFIETLVGAIPFAGDVFDAAFKANMRNLALLERYQLDPIRSRRSSSLFVFGFSLLLFLLIVAMIAIPVLVVVGIAQLF
jgi:hypothetical protein